MSQPIDLERLLLLLHGDRSLFVHLCDAGFLPQQEERYTLEHAEVARVAGTLVHELEVNLSGVEVVLRMRSELVTTRRQMAELVQLLKECEKSAD